MRDFTHWNGHILKKMTLTGDFPEYKYLFYPDGNSIPHDSPYHKETIFDHVCRVVDEAAKLSKRFQLSEYEHIVLMCSSTWHDCGKIFVRHSKTRLICDICGRPHSMKFKGNCKTSWCDGKNLIPTVVHGYNNHAKVGASDWIWGNISKREELSSELSLEIKILIENHLNVLTAIQKGEEYPFTKVSLLLSWADDKGRDGPSFEEPVDFNELYRRLKND